MYNQKAKTPASPSSPGGTRYFNHFPSNFLKPYGLASPPPDDNTLQRRINPISCEWLKHPHIPMSEFAATMVENLNWLASSPSDFVNHKALKETKDNGQELLEALSNLNTKNPGTAPLPDHVKVVPETLYNDATPIHSVMTNMLLIACRIDLMVTAELIHTKLVCSPTLTHDTRLRTAVSPRQVRVLQVPARKTQALQPILFPKLWIYFMDFPYLHCSMN